MKYDDARKSECLKCGGPIHERENEEWDRWWTHTEVEPQRIRWRGRDAGRACPGFVATPADADNPPPPCGNPNCRRNCAVCAAHDKVDS